MSYLLNILTKKKQIFLEIVEKIQITGSTKGNLTIYPGHSPLLTKVNTGAIIISRKHCKKEAIFLSESILEVQPKSVIIISGNALFSEEIDEKLVMESKKIPQKKINNIHDKMLHARISSELSKTLAQLKIIEFIKKNI